MRGLEALKVICHWREQFAISHSLQNQTPFIRHSVMRSTISQRNWINSATKTYSQCTYATYEKQWLWGWVYL